MNNYQPNYQPNGYIPQGVPEDYLDPTQIPMTPGDTGEVAPRVAAYTRQMAQAYQNQIRQASAIVPQPQPQGNQPMVFQIVLDVTIRVHQENSNG